MDVTKRIRNLMLMCAAVALTCAAMPVAAGSIEEGRKFFDDKKWEEARAEFQTVADAEPDNPLGHFWLGRVSFELDEHDLSIGFFKKAVELEETNGEYWHWTGRANGVKARTVSTMRQLPYAFKIKKGFVKAVELDPENMDARRDLIQFYIEAPRLVGGSTEKAREVLKPIAELDPIEGMNVEAKILNAEGESEAALEKSKAAIEGRPEEENYHITLGDIYASMDRKDEARAEYDKALELYPGHKNAIKGLEDLGE